jgi:hypothetical protein
MRASKKSEPLPLNNINASKRIKQNSYNYDIF